MNDTAKNEAPATTEEESNAISFAELLESKPPGGYYRISDIQPWDENHFSLKFPELQLYCGSESCGGIRFFHAENPGPFQTSYGQVQMFADYYCRNCKKALKAFAIWGYVRKEIGGALLGKIGELPDFGPPTPSRVISLIGPDREIFLKGRSAEIASLGIGAFAYYRRVVENQKGRIIAEIAKVAKRLGAKEETLKQFEKALKETQFSSAIDDIKDGIPQSLLIRGHNPLTLLHGALSEGLHAQTDEECLQIASSIRIVMTELADRLSNALKDEAELTTAVSRLLNRRKS